MKNIGRCALVSFKKALYNKSLLAYSILMPDLSRRIDTPIVLKMLDLTRNEKVLDIGCGTGVQTIRLIRARLIVGLDTDVRLIKFARLISQIRGIANVIFVAADAKYLPFRNGIFDKVLCNCTLEHIPDDKSVIREISKTLRKGGTFVLTVPNETKGIFDQSNILRKAIRWPQLIKRLLLQNYLHNVRGLDEAKRLAHKGVAHFHLYTIPTLSTMLEKEGFRVHESKYYDRIFGAIAADIKYTFRGNIHFFNFSVNILFPLLYFIAVFDKWVPEDICGYGIAVKSIKYRSCGMNLLWDLRLSSQHLMYQQSYF